MATLKDAERARAESAEQLRELGAHAISVEEGNDDQPTEETAAKPSYVVVAYFDQEPPAMPNDLEVGSGKKARKVPLKTRRSGRFTIESSGEAGHAPPRPTPSTPKASARRGDRPGAREPPEPAPQGTLEALVAIGTPELVGRNCKRRTYQPLPAVEPLTIDGPFIAYASPDSTYAVTRRLLEGAQSSILIGIYDLTAAYIVELLEDAIGRGVEVTLMLDLDGRTGETPLFDRLATAGAECVPAPSCASAQSRFFASSHEKVVVIDDEWTLVQSGNWSENSIPRNELDGGDPSNWVHGNRDMGIAVKDAGLAAFYTMVLRRDIDLELHPGAPEAGAADMAAIGEIEAAQKAPERPPLRTFTSRTFEPDHAVSVRPILSPENYMSTIPGVIADARRFVYIEQQYIRGGQAQIATLLDAIVTARTSHPGLVVRIVLAAPFPGSRFDREADAIRALSASHGLSLDDQVRILNPRYLVHCHNKLIVVDDARVLVSSQNWSDSAVTLNREAGLLIEDPAIARYFRTIFNLDWRTGRRTLDPPKGVFAPEALGEPGIVPLESGDYAEV
jgi:phosphatidylserine/phosphatidylglycerophosphate/cardiolipin synthase-like enzyme